MGSIPIFATNLLIKILNTKIMNTITFCGVIPAGCFCNRRNILMKSDTTRVGISIVPEDKRLFVNFNGDLVTVDGDKNTETPRGLRKPTADELHIWALTGFGQMCKEEFDLIAEATLYVDLPDPVPMMGLKGRGVWHNNM